MTSELIDPLGKLRNALNEVRQNRALLSDETFTTVVMALLERIRRLQTVANSTGATSDEVRLVTVMFIDVKDSTLIAQSMDASDFKSMLEEAHRRMSVLVGEWEGTVGQYLGDGILTFFGARKSRGDDALRCVACGIAIQSAMEEYANEVFLQHGVEFAARVGISTGRLVVGMVGGTDRQELLALGPATNLAARLQSEAPAGGVMIDNATASRVRGQFNLRVRPTLRVKGFEDPILMYEVLGRNATLGAQLTQTALGAFPIPMVGRDAELAEVTSALTLVGQRGQLRSIMIVGEMGMGKSRLMQETLNRSDQESFLRVTMIAYYELRTRPHNLLRYFLTQYCQLTDAMTLPAQQTQIVRRITSVWTDADAATTAEVLGYLAGYGFEDSAFVTRLFSDTELGYRTAYEMLARLIRALAHAAHASPLLVVDNLQWADPYSIRMLEFLAQALGDLPGMILTAARPTIYDSAPAYMAGFAAHQIITLEGLNDEIIQYMIETILKPINRVPAGVIRPIVERAEGNPLFVLEFLGLLFDSGVFNKARDGRWRFNLVLYDSTYKTLPAGLIEVVQSRLDDLTPDVRLMLQLAAVIGQPFWKSILEEMAGADPSALLDTLIQRTIILPQTDSAFEGETQYAFRHMLYREVAYEMLPRARRELYHRQVSKWLITRIAGKPDFFGILADQFEAGGETEAALFTYLEAAQNRLQRGLLSETLKLVEKALAMARNLPRDIAIGVTVQLWTLQAQSLSGLGRYSECTAAAQSALRLFGEMPPDYLVAVKVNAVRLLGSAYVALGSYELAASALEQAYNWADETDHSQMTSVLRAFGVLNLHQGRLQDALSYCERSLTHANITQVEGEIVATRNFLGAIALEQGRYGDALEQFEFCLEANHAMGFIHHEAADLRNIGMVYMLLQQTERARVTFDLAISLRQQLDERDTLLDAWRAQAEGALGDAASALNRTREILSQEHRDQYTWHQIRLLLLDAHFLAEDYGGARQLAQQMLNEVEPINQLMYGRVMLRLGRIKYQLTESNALGVLLKALAIEQTSGGRDLWLAHLWVAEASARHEARQHYAATAQIIQSQAHSLARKPDLQYAFLATPLMRDILVLGK